MRAPSSIFDVDIAFNALLNMYWNDTAGSRITDGNRLYPFLEAANYVGANNPKIIALIKKMKASKASMTTSLHFFAQYFGRSYFTSVPKASRFVTTGFTPEQKARCIAGYTILAGYVKRMHDEGVMLAIGTDHKDGGRAVLSEMILLSEAGIPMKDVLRIATVNSAKYIEMENIYGSIEKGKKANLVIFDKDPLHDPRNLLEKKTVIKDGKLQ
jgi:hypothetical protein